MLEIKERFTILCGYITVGAKSMARLESKLQYVYWLNYISAPRYAREVWFFLFYRSWIGEQF
jgi:hypothetical protein